MFCRICGNRIPDDSHFCPYCGEKVVLGDSKPILKQMEDKRDTDEDIVPLKVFAQKNGRMQLCKAASTDGNMTRYLLFTKEIKVQMSEETSTFSSADIKARKEELVIHKAEDGGFVLEISKNKAGIV